MTDLLTIKKDQNMNFIKYMALVLVLMMGVSACELPDNVDPKRPTDVPISTLFTNAQVAFVNQVDEVSVNLNIDRLITQYWQETTYFNESRYDFQDRGISDGYWDRFYRNTLRDLKEAKDLLNEQELSGVLAAERANKIAVIEIMEVYSYQCLVDAFGNVPYTEALQATEGNSQPAYDDAATIYADIMTRLSSAVNALDDTYNSWGDADLIYGGDVAMWKKFGASLQMRLGMRLADVNDSAARAAVEAGANNGAFSDPAEAAKLVYIGVVPHVNNIYEHFVVDNRKDYLPTNTIIDMMVSLEDPRIDDWFTLGPNGVYEGAVVGLNGAQSFFNFSNFTAPFLAADFEAMLMDYVEVEFLKAEAAERWGMFGSAEEHYNNAIQASILYWGGTQDEVDAYLANPDVAYSSGAWKQKIGTQKWLALYNRAVESWAEWRRLDYPCFNVPEEFVYLDIPRRYPYPYDEGELNGPNYEAAIATLGGPDNHKLPLFWDVNTPPSECQ